LEGADFLVRAVAVPPVALLQLPGQVFGIAFGHVEDVVGQVAPLGLGLALELLPVAGNDVLVHASPHWLVWFAVAAAGSPSPRCVGMSHAWRPCYASTP